MTNMLEESKSMNQKNIKILVSVFVLLGTILSACQSPAATQDADLTPIRLTLGFIPNIQFAPIYVALEKGYFSEAGFVVTLEYGNEADAIALIGAGEQTFAIASGEQILLARAQGLPVTFVAAWYDEYPVGVVFYNEDGINSPADLEGKTVGIPGQFGASYIGFIALLSSGGLTEEDVTLLSIGFNQVEALATNQVEASVIYLANEPIVLRSMGYEVDVLRVSDYLDLISNGLVTNEESINSDPEMVAAFTAAFLRGVRDTAEDPDEAYEISMNYVENLAEADRSVQESILLESIKLYQTDQPGYSDPAAWENMQQVLLDMGLLTEPQSLENAFTNDLLP